MLFRSIDESLRRVLLTLWQTRILRSVRLTVADEIENGLAYFNYTFLREVPRLYGEIEDLLDSRHGNGRIPVGSLLRVGNWIGGDRDGNPFVTHEVTLHAAKRQSSLAFDHYLVQVHRLGSELSQARRQVEVTPALDALAAASPDRSEHRLDEPYRRALTGIYARLAATARALGHELDERRPIGSAAPYAASEIGRAHV